MDKYSSLLEESIRTIIDVNEDSDIAIFSRWHNSFIRNIKGLVTLNSYPL